MGLFLVDKLVGGLTVALFYFPIVWLIMRRRDGQKLKLSNWWVLGGWLATAIGSAIANVVATSVIIQDNASLTRDQSNVLFSVIIPVISAVAVCAFLQTRAKPAAGSKST